MLSKKKEGGGGGCNLLLKSMHESKLRKAEMILYEANSLLQLICGITWCKIMCFHSMIAHG